MGEISKRDFFCLDNFRALNGERYRPEDNRTYIMPPLSPCPTEDIRIHLGVPETPGKGGALIRTNQGSFIGHDNVQIDEKAAKLILHFPKASEIKTPKGVVQIDRKKLASLYPSWMITRYGRNNLPEDLTLRHEVPLFLDKKTKEFLYFFDESFLSELDPKILTEDLEPSLYSLYRSTSGERLLALRAKSFDAFENLKGNSADHSPMSHAFNTIRDNYKRLTLDAQSLEQVIVISFSEDNVARTNRGTRIEHGLGTSLSLTFAMAARYSENYYWVQPDGTIDSQVTNVVDRSHAKERNAFTGLGGPSLSDLRGDSHRGANIVIPYTYEDWRHLLTIKERLEDIQKTLGDLIDGCKGPVGSSSDASLEQGFASIASASLLGIGSDKSD